MENVQLLNQQCTVHGMLCILTHCTVVAEPLSEWFDNLRPRGTDNIQGEQGIMLAASRK